MALSLLASVVGEPSAWPLYPSGVAPFDLPGFYPNESVKHWPAGQVLFNVTNVTLTPYLVDASHPQFTGASVIVAPGGAYKWLTYDAEGTDIVAWLNAIGVSAFLLKYRVPFRPWLEPGAEPSCCNAGVASCCITTPNYSDPHSARGPLIDAQRAFSVVRCGVGRSNHARPGRAAETREALPRCDAGRARRRSGSTRRPWASSASARADTWARQRVAVLWTLVDDSCLTCPPAASWGSGCSHAPQSAASAAR